MLTITLTHRVEMAHRLSHPDAPIKCQSIHGHSWRVDVTLTAKELDSCDMLMEFGVFKRAWRAVLDARYDHCLIVARGDVVADAIRRAHPDARITEIEAQPTTESIAQDIAEQTTYLLTRLGAVAILASVHLQETPSNAASYHV